MELHHSTLSLVAIALVAIIAVAGISFLGNGSQGAATLDESAAFGLKKGDDCAKKGVEARSCCDKLCVVPEYAACALSCMARVEQLKK